MGEPPGGPLGFKCKGVVGGSDGRTAVMEARDTPDARVGWTIPQRGHVTITSLGSDREAEEEIVMAITSTESRHLGGMMSFPLVSMSTAFLQLV